MNPDAVAGHRVALLLVMTDEEGNIVGDEHALRTGDAEWDGKTLRLRWPDEDEDPFQIPAELWEHIQPVEPGEMAEETEADFYLTLPVRPLPEGGEYSPEYRPLGWKWPDTSEPPDRD
jgi:hypothetical protein